MSPLTQSANPITDKTLYIYGLVEDRFWTYVDKTGDCWLWLGSNNGVGYGQIRLCGTLKYAHRISYELKYGPVPSGLYVLHKCDTPSCINPDHLFIGRQVDNVKDMITKGRDNHARGSRIYLAKLTEENIVEIRKLFTTGLTQQKIADLYNVSDTAISDIFNHRTWNHVK